MRGQDIHPRAARRIRSDHTSTAPSEFRHRVLADGVHDDVLEDSQLATLEDAIASLEDVRDERRETLRGAGDQGRTAGEPLPDLHRQARDRVRELCAARAGVVLADGDTWVAEGFEDAADVAAATREAAAWLRAHPDVRERVFEDDPLSTLATDGGRPQLHVGDHVQDRDDEGETPATMLAARVPVGDASGHEIDADGTTVADVNPDYPADDDVVEVVFPSRSDTDLTPQNRYAYPRGRLERTAAIHEEAED
ncbi:hypothetical protein J2752_000481 [Halarchaeum rubridurum]|uniref:Uncharacterized protein n=1 Tax=Halarchaeum rubridurum TaxID=489911 RepID=A0A830FNB7_9EURY|nr:hypothetical protein [Halarchaeum rubridurum]MBP1953600.1 hypothetical protein [Halarchaeum rubridurum]GGM64039.1 hypothetical protein GCM10009017_12630 [Halarchaeum rubridurum]